jgi:hypothetical protein
MVGTCPRPADERLSVSYQPLVVVYGVCVNHFEAIQLRSFVEASADPIRGLIGLSANAHLN